MINQNTVFILGAGASAPYGYPTGLELRHWLRAQMPQIANNEFRIRQRLEEPERQAFLDELAKFSDEFNDTSSRVFIDLFLSRRKEFHGIGKWAIIAAIFFHEFHSRYGDNIDNPQLDWMSILFHIMTSDITDENFNRICENKVSFITFNYDRSLEYYFHRSICKDFGASQKEAAEILGGIPIVHVYGCISPMIWQDSSGMKFQPAFDKVDPGIFSKNIQVMYSDRTAKASKKAKELIEDAKFLYFLGFGYDKDNLDAIGIPTLLTNEHVIRGTAYSITGPAQERARKRMSGDKVHKTNVILEPNTDSAELLRKNFEI